MIDKTIAEFAASISGALSQVDKSKIDASRANLANKINPYDFLKEETAPKAKAPIFAPTPELAANLIPLPPELKDKESTINSQPLPITDINQSTPVIVEQNTNIESSKPIKPTNQLEFAFNIETQPNTPSTPREMFLYFKERIELLERQQIFIINLLKELRDNRKRKKESTTIG
jgi:hypothetical protein